MTDEVLDLEGIHERNCGTVAGGPCTCSYRKLSIGEIVETALGRHAKRYGGVADKPAEPADRNSRWFGPTLGEAMAAASLRAPDVVNHPAHYQLPGGIEAIQITEHMNFNRGNAVKYLLRAGKKTDEIEDLKKARWYIDREIARLTPPQTDAEWFRKNVE